MKKVLNIKNIVILLFSLLLFINVIPIGADSGFDSSWDSGSSWDSDSSWDWGSDRDHDRNSRTNSNTSTTDIIMIFSIIICLFMIDTLLQIIVRRFIKSIKTNQNNEDLYRSSKKELIKELNIEDIKKFIPDYDEEIYKNKFYNIYVEIQQAWMNFDYDTLKKFTTNELYNMYSMQLDTLKVKNEQNIMSDFKLVNFRIKRITKENGLLIVEVYMTIEMYDYLVTFNTNKVLRGANKRKIHIDYLITFVKVDNECDEIKCPNCGAKLDINTSGKCPYCDSEVVVSPNDFVMSKKENIGQRML